LAAIRVVAALIFNGRRLLVCQRKESGPFPLKWEFPGGKIEEGEKEPEALRRELHEELGIETQTAEEIFRHRHVYSNGTRVELIFFRVDGYRGKIANREFREIRWAALEELGKLDFLEGDLPMINRLRGGGTMPSKQR
jgi:8-oxo-dGTP diphosphatase